MKKNTRNSNYFINKYIYLIHIYEEQIKLIQKRKAKLFYKKKYEELEKNYNMKIMNIYLKIEEELKAIDNI